MAIPSPRRTLSRTRPRERSRLTTAIQPNAAANGSWLGQVEAVGDCPPGRRVCQGGAASGGRGIRTLGRLATSPVFKTGAIGRSAIPPDRSRKRSRELSHPSAEGGPTPFVGTQAVPHSSREFHAVEERRQAAQQARTGGSRIAAIE